MCFEHDVAVPMPDGVVLRANVFRPDDAQRHPVIIAMSPYGKDYDMRDYVTPAWNFLVRKYPQMIGANSSCRHWVWETVDPERFVPEGYAVVRVDARGAGRSPGVAEHLSTQMARDYVEAIEWAASQPWSNGRVGSLGVSYYSWMTWLAAAQNPPHLAAAMIWEGANDWFRDIFAHGGVPVGISAEADPADPANAIPFGLSNYPNQHGLPTSPLPSGVFRGVRQGPNRPTGPEELSYEELAANRVSLVPEFKDHPLDDGFYRSRNPNLSNIRVPILMAGNWGGHGLHGRGALEAWNQVATNPADKWLTMHTGAHWEEFYIDRGVALQKAFFGHYLKGEDGDWRKSAHVQLSVRTPSGSVLRHEHEYPLVRTRFAELYLDAASRSIGESDPVTPATATYLPLDGSGVTFRTEPLQTDLEILGPVAVRLWLSSATEDTDLFVTLHAFDPGGDEVTFLGANDPKGPVSHGWLRVSQRRIDPKRSTPGRPWHTHNVTEDLVPGEIYPVDVEIWATSMVFPKGYRLGLTVNGQDYFSGPGARPIPHADPVTRPAARYGGLVTLHTGAEHRTVLTLPVIPPQ
jgi:uncharacterized protein